MTGSGIEIEAVKALEFADALERFALEGAFAVEGVKNYAFEEIAESEIVILGECLEDFEEALFHADAGLDALNRVASVRGHRSSHMLPMYHGNTADAIIVLDRAY